MELPELAGQDRDKRIHVKAQMILASIRGLFFSRMNRHLKISSLGLVEEATHSSGSQAFLAYPPLHIGFGRTQSPRCQVFQGQQEEQMGQQEEWTSLHI